MAWPKKIMIRGIYCRNNLFDDYKQSWKMVRVIENGNLNIFNL